MKNKKRFFKNALFLMPWLFSFSVFPVFSIYKENLINSSNIVSKKNDSNEVLSKSASSPFNGFNSYIPIVNNETYQSISTEIGFLGKSNDSKTVVLTSYGGMIVWKNKIDENDLIKEFYKSKGINDLSSYSVQGWVTTTINSIEYVVVLYGDTQNNNQIVFALNGKNGLLYTPYINEDKTISYERNITFIGSGAKVLYKMGDFKILAMGLGTSEEITKTINIINVNANSISNVVPNTTSIAESPSDIFAGFTPGYQSINNEINFFHFINPSTKAQYVVAVDINIKNVMNGNNKVKYDFDNFEDSESTIDALYKFNVNNVIKYGFPIYTNASNTSLKFAYATFGKKSKLYILTYDKNAKTFTKNNDIDISGQGDTPTNVIFDIKSNRLYFSILKSTSNNLITYVDVTSSTPKYESLKKNTNSLNSGISKPWIMTPVVNSGANKAYIAINDKNQVVKNYIKSDNTTTTETMLDFTDYYNPLEKINDAKINVNYAASYLANNLNLLVSYLELTNNNNNQYKITVVSGSGNDDIGVVNFSYRVTYNKWWNSSETIFFDIPITIKDFYVRSKVSLKFVTNSTIDNDKFNKINDLKKSKTANQITKKEVLDNFFIYSIVNNHNNSVTLTESDIKITSEENGYSLKVEVTIPQSTFPMGFSKQVYTSYFKGFNSILGYDAKIRNDNDNVLKPFKTKFPSQVTFSDVINYFMDLDSTGYSFSRVENDWTYESEFDDYTGTFTIKNLIYKGSVPNGFPDSKKIVINISNRPTFTNFKNLIALFVEKPTINEATENLAGFNLPTQLWEEYIAALESKNENSIKRTLLYSSLNFNLVNSILDLNVIALNLSTANNDKMLRLEVKIKDNATLNIKHIGKDLVFNDEVESKLKQYKKDYYPFIIEWKITSKDYFFHWNIPSGPGFQQTIIDNIETLIVDLDKQSWQLVDRQMYASDFVSNETTYKTAIVQLFNYSDNYEIIFSNPIYNDDKGIVIIRINFRLKDDKTNFKSKTFNISDEGLSKNLVKEITIKGFKLTTSPFTIVLPILTSILVALLLSIIFTFVWLRSKKIKKNSNNVQVFANVIKREKRVIINTNSNYIENKKIKNNDNNKNADLVVNRFKGKNLSYNNKK